MAAADSMDVTLVPVDTSILSCWEEKVKQGIECSLLLKHSKGKVITTLKCSLDLQPPKARDVSSLTPSIQAEKKGRMKKKKKTNNKGGKKRKLASLLAYHQRLVVEKGLPPSRLMLEQAAQTQLSTPEKGSQKPESLRHSELNQSLNSSFAMEEREEISSVNADTEEPDVEELERIRCILEETNHCYFCEYTAPVPWIHPSKGVNLSGMDIWDHVWSDHPKESEWFA